MTALDDQFDAWKAKAREVGMVEAAAVQGAKLKRSGQEHVGPCPVCGGTDTLGLNPGKGVFVCRRGNAGGDVIALVQHIAGVDFLAACEILTGEAPPRGRGREISDEDRAAAEENRRRRDADAARREAQEADRRARRSKTALQVWQEATPIAGTLAERYLVGRGLPVPPAAIGWPVVLGFHEGLEYELHGGPLGTAPIFPALVALIEDPDGKPIGVWRIFLDPRTGGKAPVDKPKLGMGEAMGGAVRLGGDAKDIGVAEGLETALAAWTIRRYRTPVWAMLSTSGMKGFEPPLSVARVTILPDGDSATMTPDGKIRPPAGITAARALKARLDPSGIRCAIVQPPSRADFLDVLTSAQRAFNVPA